MLASDKLPHYAGIYNKAISCRHFSSFNDIVAHQKLIDKSKFYDPLSLSALGTTEMKKNAEKSRVYFFFIWI